jgi:hypothetical protein
VPSTILFGRLRRISSGTPFEDASASDNFVFNYGCVNNFAWFWFSPYGSPFVLARMKFNLGARWKICAWGFCPSCLNFGVLRGSKHGKVGQKNNPWMLKKKFVTSRLESRWCFMRLSIWITWGHKMWYVEIFENSSCINLFKNLFSISFAKFANSHIVKK